MLSEIEELEKRLTRRPAESIESPETLNVEGTIPDRGGANYINPIPSKDVFQMPESTKFSDPSRARILPNTLGGGEKIVGAKQADYSGYDDLLKRLEGIKPKDTSTQDLISMGLSTGLGALFGRVGAAAKVAGDYGTDRYNKAEKRDNELEDMILKLQAAKAEKMATATKGTRMKSGVSSSDAPKFRYRDSQGMLRTPQFLDENGQWVQDETDPVYSMPPSNTFDQKLPDGTVIQMARMGNQVKQIGSMSPDLATEKNAKGETVLVNRRSGEVQNIGSEFNKTPSGLTPYSANAYEAISNKKSSDPLLRGIEGSYNDMSLGMTALGRGDIAGALAATKMAASALEKGRMTSDKDLAQVSGINLGVAMRLEKMLQDAVEGGKLTEGNRRELESLFSMIEANNRDAHARRLGNYNKQAQTLLGAEWRPELTLRGLPKFTGSKQDTLIQESMNTAKDTVSTGEFKGNALDANGNVVMDEFGNPKQVIYINRKGVPTAIREVAPYER